MLSQRSSTTDSRKSPRRRSGARLLPATLLVLGSLLLPRYAPAQISHESSVRPRDSYLSVSLAVGGAEPEELFANLHDGLTARLEYSMRLLALRPMPASILGPRLIREFQIAYEMRWDPFRRRYTAQTHDGAFYTFRDEASLWSFIFSLSDYRIPWEAFASTGGASAGNVIAGDATAGDAAAGDAGAGAGGAGAGGADGATPGRAVRPQLDDRYHLQTRVVYQPIVFVPGLAVLSVLPGRARETSGWTTHEIEVPQ